MLVLKLIPPTFSIYVFYKIPQHLPVITHQVVHPEEVVVDVHVVALEPPDDLPEAGQLVHDRCQARGAPTPTHHHAPVHLGRLPDLLDSCR